MFPSRWIQLPCMNIEYTRARYSFLSGKYGRVDGSDVHAVSSPNRTVSRISSTASGRPWTTSQGMAAVSKVNSSLSSLCPACCTRTHTPTQMAMMTTVTTAVLRVGFSSFSGSTVGRG
jgi:hypothetical protein